LLGIKYCPIPALKTNHPIDQEQQTSDKTDACFSRHRAVLNEYDAWVASTIRHTNIFDYSCAPIRAPNHNIITWQWRCHFGRKPFQYACWKSL